MSISAINNSSGAWRQSTFWDDNTTATFPIAFSLKIETLRIPHTIFTKLIRMSLEALRHRLVDNHFCLVETIFKTPPVHPYNFRLFHFAQSNYGIIFLKNCFVWSVSLIFFEEYLSNQFFSYLLHVIHVYTCIISNILFTGTFSKLSSPSNLKKNKACNL